MRETSQANSIASTISPERGDRTTRVEGFVDAAFAFSVTLLVISGDHLPHSVNDLILAVKSVPTFAASFALILVFWTGHAQWSRRYGLDDATTRRLSLLLVFLVLIFVYPLRMVFAVFFAFVSGNWLPVNFAIGSWSDIAALFVTYGIAYGALCIVMWALYHHAWNSRKEIELSREECIVTRLSQFKWALQILATGVSILLALLIMKIGSSDWSWQLGLPGYAYGVNMLGRSLFVRRYEHRLRALDASA